MFELQLIVVPVATTSYFSDGEPTISYASWTDFEVYSELMEIEVD